MVGVGWSWLVGVGCWSWFVGVGPYNRGCPGVEATFASSVRNVSIAYLLLFRVGWSWLALVVGFGLLELVRTIAVVLALKPPSLPRSGI